MDLGCLWRPIGWDGAENEEVKTMMAWVSQLVGREQSTQRRELGQKQGLEYISVHHIGSVGLRAGWALQPRKVGEGMAMATHGLKKGYNVSVGRGGEGPSTALCAPRPGEGTGEVIPEDCGTESLELAPEMA